MPKRSDSDLGPGVGAETEEDLDKTSNEEIRQAFITGSDWTYETIVSQLRKGNIDLTPSFQRREVWTPTRKSTLIESIVLNLPVPQIVLAERKDRPNTFIVLDGKQRLLAVRQFCVDQNDERDKGFDALFLRSLGVLSELNGETYQSISGQPSMTDIVNAFDNHTIRTVVIRNWPDDDYLHRVFLRLNTGSVPLSPQELRQALKPGPFTDFLNESAGSNKALQRALGIDGPDFRMRDNEILLRFFCFALNASSYSGNMKRFLDGTLEDFNSRWDEIGEESMARDLESCSASIEATVEIFGEDDSFSSFDGEFQGRFNRAVFDIMTYYFRHPDIASAAKRKRNEVKQSFVDLSRSDRVFFQSLTTTTKSKGATAARFVRWAEALERVTGLKVDAPKGYTELLA